MDWEAYKEHFRFCRNCSREVNNDPAKMKVYKNFWENTKTICCVDCYHEVEKAAFDKYFVEELDGIGIFKFDGRFFFGLYSGMNVETIEDARIVVKGLINKWRFAQ